MQSSAHFPIAANQASHDEFGLSRWLTGALVLWLPLLLFGATMWFSQHNVKYAFPADMEDALVDVTPSMARQLSFVALGSYGALLLFKPARLPLTISGRLLACLISLCLLLVLSVFWADNFELSFKRSMVAVLTLIAALGIAKQWHPNQVCSFSVLLTSIFLLLGVANEIASGTFLRGPDYRFAGTLHPNVQAVNCAVLSLASLALYRDARQRTSAASSSFWLLGFGVGTLFLVLTKSRTASAAFLLALLFFLTLGMSRGKKLLILGAVALFFSVFAILAMEADVRLGSLLFDAVRMGREQEAADVSSLSGRIQIWEEILKDVAERPWFGYGYGGFWTPHRVAEYAYIHDWEFGHAHSAYLETLLHVGVVGLAMGLLMVRSAIRSADRAFQATGDCGYRFAAAMLALALIHGFLDANFITVGFESTLALICVSVIALHGRQTVDDDAPPELRNTCHSNWRESHA